MSTAVPSTTPASSSSAAAAPAPGKFELAEYKKRLAAIYEVHNPSNVEKVDYLLNKYLDREDLLYNSVCKKYNVPDSWDGVSPLSYAALPSAEGGADVQPAGENKSGQVTDMTVHKMTEAETAQALGKALNTEATKLPAAALPVAVGTMPAAAEAPKAAPASETKVAAAADEAAPSTSAAKEVSSSLQAAKGPVSGAAGQEEDDYDPFGGDRGEAAALAALQALTGAISQDLESSKLEAPWLKSALPIPSAKGMALIDYLLVGDKMGFFSDEEDVADDPVLREADTADQEVESDGEDALRYQQQQQQLLREQQQQQQQEQQRSKKKQTQQQQQEQSESKQPQPPQVEQTSQPVQPKKKQKVALAEVDLSTPPRPQSAADARKSLEERAEEAFVALPVSAVFDAGMDYPSDDEDLIFVSEDLPKGANDAAEDGAPGHSLPAETGVEPAAIGAPKEPATVEARISVTPAAAAEPVAAAAVAAPAAAVEPAAPAAPAAALESVPAAPAAALESVPAAPAAAVKPVVADPRTAKADAAPVTEPPAVVDPRPARHTAPDYTSAVPDPRIEEISVASAPSEIADPRTGKVNATKGNSAKAEAPAKGKKGKAFGDDKRLAAAKAAARGVAAPASESGSESSSDSSEDSSDEKPPAVATQGTEPSKPAAPAPQSATTAPKPAAPAPTPAAPPPKPAAPPPKTAAPAPNLAAAVPPKPAELGRDELIGAIFQDLGAFCKSPGRATVKAMQRFMTLVGFEGSDNEWRAEYQSLCKEWKQDALQGFEQAAFSKMVNDKSEMGVFCSDGELRNILGKLLAVPPKPPAKQKTRKRTEPASEPAKKPKVAEIDDSQFQ